jgi:hypothetical protein
MRFTRDGRFVRTDIWREGQWLDLWSVVHLLSGTSIGLGIFFLHFTPLASVLLTLVSLVAYEMWETIVKIEETPANRVMDVVVGMASFLPAYFFLAPALSTSTLILVFGIVCTVNVVMSIFGWYASQKAAVLEKRVREKYATQRAKFAGKKGRLHHTLHS